MNEPGSEHGPKHDPADEAFDPAQDLNQDPAETPLEPAESGAIEGGYELLEETSSQAHAGSEAQAGRHPAALDYGSYATAPAPGYGPRQPSSSRLACQRCGYDLTGSVIGGACPECGEHIGQSLVMNLPVSGQAIACMVLGILCVVICTFGCLCLGPVIGVPCGLVAIGLYISAKRKIDTGQFHANSTSMNIAGLVCSIIGLVFGIPYIGLLIIGFLSD